MPAIEINFNLASYYGSFELVIFMFLLLSQLLGNCGRRCVRFAFAGPLGNIFVNVLT